MGLFRPEDVVLDAMAGIGPFAIPAAQKGCLVSEDATQGCQGVGIGTQMGPQGGAQVSMGWVLCAAWGAAMKPPSQPVPQLPNMPQLS